jgi:hypothetical protein
MSTPAQQLSLSRFLRRSFAFACAAMLLMGSSAKAETIVSFSQLTSTDVVVASESGGVTTFSTTSPTNVDGGGVSVPVDISIYLGMTQVPFPLLAYETVAVTSTAGATTSSGTISQTYSGTIQFTVNPGVAGPGNPAFLIATFGPTGVFSGSTGGGSASLNASVPQDTVTFTVPGSGMTFSDANLSISFSGITMPPGLSTTADSVSSFTGQNAGTFSASIVPEPGTLCLASVAVVIGTLAYGRKRMKK